MKILILLIIVSIGVAVFFLLAFFWAIKNEQFEDEYGEARRMLFEDPKSKSTPNNQPRP